MSSSLPESTSSPARTKPVQTSSSGAPSSKKWCLFSLGGENRQSVDKRSDGIFPREIFPRQCVRFHEKKNLDTYSAVVSNSCPPPHLTVRPWNSPLRGARIQLGISAAVGFCLVEDLSAEFHAKHHEY